MNLVMLGVVEAESKAVGLHEPANAFVHGQHDVFELEAGGNLAVNVAQRGQYARLFAQVLCTAIRFPCRDLLLHVLCGCSCR